jgi:hypothetical protein
MAEGGVQFALGGRGLVTRAEEVHVDVPGGLGAGVPELIRHELNAGALVDEDARERMTAGVRCPLLGEHLDRPQVCGM